MIKTNFSYELEYSLKYCSGVFLVIALKDLLKFDKL
ncbi:hypothetical protein GALL_516570 [mine drainage metagenome]|uniref:Uncharacterized protein n=1 Tax=mine drainage metagenome TaxID=410659 RepID=A0A1J5PNA5_9ZZZZ